MTGGCGRCRADLSALVDETLPARRREQVLYHLAGCSSCREELRELTAVLAKLSRCRASAAPGALTAKLESIAGEHAAAPLYMATGKGQLPTSRHRRRVLVAQGGAALLVVMVSVVVLAVLVAPEPARVLDPVGDAREQYARSTAAINVNESVGAMLLAGERGADFGAPVNYVPPDTDAAFEEITLERAAEVLATAVDSDVSVTGTQRVYIAADEGGYLTTQVEVVKSPSEGARLSVVDAQGHTFTSTFLPNSIGIVEAPDRWSFVEASATVEIAGRRATRVAAVGDDELVASWWVDTETGVLLWAERYGTDGQVSVAFGYTEVEFGAAALAPNEQIIALSPVTSSGGDGWCVGLAECPEELGGLPLVAFTSVENDGTASMSLVYSDGVDTAVVGWSTGLLEEGATTRADARAGLPSVLAWQCGDLVVTLAANSSSDVMADMVDELPAAKAFHRSPMDRVLAGMGRLVGIG